MFFLILRRIASMILIMVVVSLTLSIVFEFFKMDVAGRVLGQYSSAQQRELWLENNGFGVGAFEGFWDRYIRSWTGYFTGDLGISIETGRPVSEVLWPRLANTGILAGLTFLFMIPIALTLGVLSGMREGSFQDRSISVFSVITTSIPEFAMAAILSAIFVYQLKWLPGTSSFANGFSWQELVLPVAVLVIYDMGYVARMTRASMAEVMQSQYIRTAILKGVPFKTVIRRHALRNALIAPFTVIVLQLNWLLSGVIVVEVFFSYKGFGKTIYDAALFGDANMLNACTLIAVFVAVMSQLISDIGYVFLNPRIRF